MPLQKKNADLVDSMAAYFPKSSDPAYAWARVVGASLAVPGIRAYWPMSSISTTGPQDLSGQGRALTMFGTVSFGVSDLRAYATLDGSTEHLARSDEAGLEFANSFTAMGWFYFARAVGSVEYLFAKGVVGSTGYHLARAASGALTALINTKSFASTLAPETDAWSHVAIRHTTAAELAIWVNGVSQVDTASIPVAPSDTINSFVLGRQSSSAAGYFQGNLAHIVLSAVAVPDVAIWSHFQQTRALYGV